MFKIILMLLFSWVFSIFSFKLTTPLEPTINNSAMETANYICDNLHLLNEYASENGYNTSIKSCNAQELIIETLDNQELGVYIDFNDNNGFITLGENLTIYDIAFEGKSLIDNGNKEELKFNVLDGYSYKGMEISTIEDEEFYSYDGYDGVDSDGTIENLGDYVKDRYGSSYKKHKSKSVTSDLGERQYPLSVYIKDDGKYLYSEGNCGLVSVYNHLLYFYNERDYTRLPATETRKFDPSKEEPKLYKEKKADGNYDIYDTEDIGYQKYFSQLYIDARLEAYRINDGPEGLTVWESRDILNHVMDKYNYSKRFKIIEIWSTSTVTNRVDDGEALLWSTLTGAYGNHTMFVSGYNIYVKETKILFLKVKTYKDFLEIRDGWNSGKRYYDFNGLNNGTLLGAFVVEK